MRMSRREILKAVARGVAHVAAAPLVASFAVRAPILGRDRALQGSTHLLSLVPGLIGQYLRRAFLQHALAACHKTAVVEFGTTFSQSGTRLDENVYIGPKCHLGLVHVERDALIAAGVHVPSGAMTHGFDSLDTPIRDQPGAECLVRIGAGAWIGEAALVLADVGPGAVVGAGAVVTRSIPAFTIAAGVPARVLRVRGAPAARAV
jgi:virginiamycin A acetyltransferase